VDEKFRLWYLDNVQHTDPTTERQKSHVVAYSGSLQYALRELVAWVEQGSIPPPTSVYRVLDGQVHVPASAARRGGIQPVVSLSVNGGERAEGFSQVAHAEDRAHGAAPIDLNLKRRRSRPNSEPRPSGRNRMVINRTLPRKICQVPGRMS